MLQVSKRTPGNGSLGVVNHVAAKGGGGGGDLQAGHLADCGTSEAVDAVGTHLCGRLAWHEHRHHELICVFRCCGCPIICPQQRPACGHLWRPPSFCVKMLAFTKAPDCD